MKTKTFLLTTLLAFGAFAFTACNDDDNNYVPDDTVVSAFNSKYPQATRVEWETKAGYKVADFNLDKKEVEAWFDTTGEWVMTETDITYNELPQAIQTAFKASAYGSWRVDDVDKIERANTETVYVIEVEQGNQEVDLHYAADGTLIKEVPDGSNKAHEPLVISGSLIDKVMEMYPNATILDLDREGAYIEIDIRHNGIHKEVLFDNNGEWVSTEWEVRKADVPEAVLNALASTQYASYKIDDIDALEKPDGMYYVFELESGKTEVHLTIKADGTIV